VQQTNSRGTFDQSSPAVKNTLFRAYCMPMYACQLWSKYTQTSMKCLRAAYNNAYRIMHCIPRNVTVRPHQVSHCVRTFDALLRNNLHRFFIRCASSTFLFICFKCLMLLTNLQFFLNYSKLLYDGDKMLKLLAIVTVFASHQCCFCVVKKNECAMYAIKYPKIRNALTVFCSSQCWSCAKPIL